MSKIKVLPDSLANKIAAGEVVERPASVVKELLENSLDAGARQINIEIEAGGKRLIRVVDNGEGMNRDDALTAFERHATSKLRSAEDLENIATLGFRGEALPSIASVSRLFLRTKIEKDVEGTEIEFSGGKLVAVRDIAWPGGTDVEVRDLFFNIPARRKFLKSDATESFHVTNLVQHYALANPALGFLLVHNGRDAIRVTPAQSPRERAYQVLGGALVEKLVEVRSEADGIGVAGFVSNPQEQRSSRDAQYFFVNGRFVRDPLIGRALSEAYRSMMPSGCHAAAVLFIDLQPADVDVNVHPAKTEVRFLHEGAVIAFIRASIADALRFTKPITRMPGIGPSTNADDDNEIEESRAFATRGGAQVQNDSRGVGFQPAPPRYKPTGTDYSGELQNASRSGLIATDPSAIQSTSSADSTVPDLSIVEESEWLGEANETSDSAALNLASSQSAADASTSAGIASLPGLGHGIKPMGQIRDSYIVATDEEGLLLVDQHVAHERVLFEQFRDQRLARVSGMQPLLIPVTVDLTPAESEAFRIVQPELEGVGIETMELSGRTIAIKTTPSGLPPGDAVALVREVLAIADRERRNFSVEQLRDDIAASLACKAAIKINMPLTPEKMQWLIDELMKTQNPMTCPHGRPIIMRMGLRDIERGFKRPV